MLADLLRNPRRISLSSSALVALTVAFVGSGCAVGKPTTTKGGQDAGYDADVGDAGVDASDSSVGFDASGYACVQSGSCCNGVLDEFVETCDPSASNATSAADRCDCDDGDPCTDDSCAPGTSAANCTCQCQHIDKRTTGGFGYQDCNDHLTCTNDITGMRDAATCKLDCQNPVLPNWDIDYCFDGLVCTLDLPHGSDPTTCTVQSGCTNPHDPNFQIAKNMACADTYSCTDDYATVDWTTCNFACNHDVNVNWTIGLCNDSRSCTIDAVNVQNAPTCQYTCSNTNDPAFQATATAACDDGKFCTTDTVTMDWVNCSYSCTHVPMGVGNACDDSDPYTDDSANVTDPLNCLYTCTHNEKLDLPDDNFVDSNGDGVDGDANNTMVHGTDVNTALVGTNDDLAFVAPPGIGGSSGVGCLGTFSNPCNTIALGIASAQATGRKHVAVSKGSYDERVVLANGISIHGGYDAQMAWSRSAANTTTITNSTVQNGQYVEAIFATNIADPTTVSRFTVTTTNPAGAPAGLTHYAIRVVNSGGSAAGGLDLRFLASSAASGTTGAAGSQGAKGTNGTNGANATSTTGAAGATANACGGHPNAWKTAGGKGGSGGTDGYDCGGDHPGSPGVSPAGDVACAGGAGGYDGNCCGGRSGGPGSPPTATYCGTDVSTSFATSASSISTAGTVTNGLWVGTNGAGATSIGEPGIGGAGGGGGGSDDICVGTGASGGGGGGGGGGGCGGGPGTGGGAGGSSFGLFVSSSFNVTVVSSTFTAGAGGAGGVGGAGGLGGDSGPYGNGIAGGSGAGSGAHGNAGRPGGRGGSGGGGAGGASVGVLVCSGTVSGVGPASGSASTGGASGAGGPTGPAGPMGTSAGYLGTCTL